MDCHLELVVRRGGEVLEGPLWNGDGRCLTYIDVFAGTVHRWTPAGAAAHLLHLGQPIGAAVPRRGGGLVIAARDGIFVGDGDFAHVELVAGIEADVPDNLMNDAKCAPQGRLWAGTRPFDGAHPSGTLYRVDHDYRWTPVVTGLTVANGLAWSPDGDCMYFIDSVTRRVDVFDFDADAGVVSARRCFAAIEDERGDVVPDGMCVDSEGASGSRSGVPAPSSASTTRTPGRNQRQSLASRRTAAISMEPWPMRRCHAQDEKEVRSGVPRGRGADRSTGKPFAVVARELGINEGTLDDWVNRDRIERGEAEGLTANEREELVVSGSAAPSWRWSVTSPSHPWSSRSRRRRDEPGRVR